MIYVLLFTGVFLNAAAQLFLKAGMHKIGHFDFTAGNIWPITLQIITNLPIFGGLFCYAASLGIWMLVLSRLEVSMAYPMISIGYVVAAFAGWYFFDESLSGLRIAGIAVIMLGVFMVSRTA